MKLEEGYERDIRAYYIIISIFICVYKFLVIKWENIHKASRGGGSGGESKGEIKIRHTLSERKRERKKKRGGVTDIEKEKKKRKMASDYSNVTLLLFFYKEIASKLW